MAVMMAMTTATVISTAATNATLIAKMSCSHPSTHARVCKHALVNSTARGISLFFFVMVWGRSAPTLTHDEQACQ